MSRELSATKTRLVYEQAGWGKMKSIHEVLQDLRDVSLDERDKGTHFESLTKRWLEISPEYSDIFDKVWTYSDWAAENDLPRTDVGIDLVAREGQTGELCAIQCKFYDPGTSIEKKHIDSFFTALSKKHFSSGLIFSTSTKWSKHAEDALAETTKPVVRVGLHDLEDSGVDWDKFSIKNPGKLELRTKKTQYKHQQEAIDDVLREFKTEDRGKLIMACGTGKTFTSLKIAEEMLPDGGTMLFLVPSIALLSQSLKEWKQESDRPITAYAVCSDSKVGKSKDDEDIQVTDLAYPATTNAKKLVAHFSDSNPSGKGFTVVFSTYQSIDVISKAQSIGVPEFDLIICDEAHRTTGVKLAGADESSFIRVHDNKFVTAKKRLYMTATPRIYAEQSKQKAVESDATLASMDDESYYGKEFHRLNFGKAVSQGLLSDYKVLVLAVSEDHVSRQLQNLLTKDGELNLDDATKIVGCYNGLLKRSSNPDDFVVDMAPMRSAVAFSRSIKDSKRLANLFEVVTAELNKSEAPESALRAEADHVDGTYNMEARLEKLDWLKEKTSKTVRILSNARCLSEGVDVPALDAVLFLNPRDSQVDVVQSVGRVMRKAPGKQYGYVILPVTVPAGKTAEEALSDNNKYKVVWQVLQALRAHDERFDAMINKIDLNGDADERLRVVGVGGGEDGDNPTSQPQAHQPTLDFPLEDWKDAILAKIVQKVGQRTYWENWAKDVSKIAERFILRIKSLLEANDEVRPAFGKFLKGLQDNLNPAISEVDAIEMLAQHMITKPVFDALFEGYSFSENNPVSLVMQEMLDVLEGNNLQTETESLEKFYDSVRVRASGISSPEGRQRIIKELYEKFFKFAFANTSERLGIVYTPIEVVDFIIQSVEVALKQEFGTSIGEKGVHVLDPFTGTGTFIVRLLQSGLIKPEQIDNKFRNELHANELVLLAYYVAAINIEEAHYALTGKFSGFPGIVLTDTFQMTEGKDELDSLGIFPDNNARAIAQNDLDIRVILGNPPYSVGQNSANDQNENLKYHDLDSKIAATYVAKSESKTRTSVYDSYIRAFRWSSDRIKERGVVCFVTNGSWLETGTADGFRKSLQEEFSSIYVFNLRGNQRTQGELSRREGGKIFGEGSRTPISVTLLVRNPDSENQGKIHYYDIGDYLSREEKLSKIASFGNMFDLQFQSINPNEHGDWINKRNSDFDSLVPLVSAGKKGHETEAVFNTHSFGAITARDAWVYNFDSAKLASNMNRTIDFYNSQVDSLRDVQDKKAAASTDSSKISWSVSLFNSLEKGTKAKFNPENIVTGLYRPFTPQNYYFDKFFNHSLLQLPKYFPKGKENIAILVSGKESGTGFSAIAIDKAPNYHALPQARVFPLWYFTEEEGPDDLLSGLTEHGGRQSAITNWALNHFQKAYGRELGYEDVFYYTLGIMNAPEYQSLYANSLSKELPRIPMAEDFWGFVKGGKELARLHLQFDALPEFPVMVVEKHSEVSKDFLVQKMKLSKSSDGYVLKYNESISLEGIPDEAVKFKVGGKSSLEWIVDRYQLKTDSASGIVNDPNSFSEDRDYILRRVRKAITFGIEATKLVATLPNLGMTK